MIQSSIRKLFIPLSLGRGSVIAQNLFKTTLTGLIATFAIALEPQASLAAERISFTLPVFGEFDLSVDSLETFAEEGKITREFDFYAKRFNEQTLATLRQILQRKFELDITAIYKQTNSPIGERLLRQFGEAVYPHPEQNGIYAIRAAVLLAATDKEEGLTPINVLRKFPGEEIQIDAGLLRSVFKETSNFFAYNDSTVKAIASSRVPLRLASTRGRSPK